MYQKVLFEKTVCVRVGRWQVGKVQVLTADVSMPLNTSGRF